MGSSPRLRLSVLGVVVISLFAVMLARLWYLQVLAAPSYELEAQANRVRLVYEPAVRGRVLDRAGRVLVDNRASNAVTVSRVQIRHRAALLARLSALLNLPVPELEKRLADKRFSPYKPVPVAEDVPESVIVYIREHQEAFPGVAGEQLSERWYPNGATAAHLLGYVGEINDRELASRKPKGYRQGDDIGKSGVEQIYEDALRGRPGVQKLEVDSKGRALRSLGRRAPVQGDDVQLTIDLDVQRLAEESLQLGLAAARQAVDRSTREHFVAPAGAVVVLDPRDGSVLAMASYPAYDPAVFVNGIKPTVFRALQDPAGYFPLTNRAVQGLYAPGSTFKLVTSIAAMKAGLINQRTTVLDRGSLRVGNRTFRNAGGFSYGRVNITRALTVSSDVFYYTLGNAFWVQRGRFGNAIQDAARQLGLGDRTGIPLPFEARGRIPDPDLRRRLHEQNPRAFPNGRWFAGDNVNLAIGQGEVAVTPLQLANAYATFANGGTVYAPRMAAAVVPRGGGPLQPISPVIVRKVDLPPSVRDPILAGLAGVTSDPRGTAHQAFAGFPTGSFPVAGKTGTAQVRGRQDTAVFMAIAPVASPQYVVGVVMEQAGFGGQSAAPVARRILQGLAGAPPGPVSLGGGVD